MIIDDDDDVAAAGVVVDGDGRDNDGGGEAACALFARDVDVDVDLLPIEACKRVIITSDVGLGVVDCGTGGATGIFELSATVVSRDLDVLVDVFVVSAAIFVLLTEGIVDVVRETVGSRIVVVGKGTVTNTVVVELFDALTIDTSSVVEATGCAVTDDTAMLLVVVSAIGLLCRLVVVVDELVDSAAIVEVTVLDSVDEITAVGEFEFRMELDSTAGKIVEEVVIEDPDSENRAKDCVSVVDKPEAVVGGKIVVSELVERLVVVTVVGRIAVAEGLPEPNVNSGTVVSDAVGLNVASVRGMVDIVLDDDASVRINGP